MGLLVHWCQWNIWDKVWDCKTPPCPIAAWLGWSSLVLWLSSHPSQPLCHCHETCAQTWDLTHVTHASQLSYHHLLITDATIDNWTLTENSLRRPKTSVIFSNVWGTSDTLFQKSLLLFLTWREYFYSQPTHFSSQPKK